jgi:hypothetical protein
MQDMLNDFILGIKTVLQSNIIFEPILKIVRLFISYLTKRPLKLTAN